ncbi:penicillin-binding protein 2 [Parasulfitobacter algicola]|uniref:Penicillin-binding protein 2 n=1 Tax=Parasulfitobacter algicola TaxID=2614809 RepID=A0ABX2IUY0_9RHOB|nr:penicillin-binding protein 2 [Sulfitobacter algicola]NSX54081.1 penicillin-binding protein 2 [Sulfitobacter algicola]
MKRSAKDTATSVQNITRRTLILGGVQVAVLGALGWRMRQLQIEQADQFRLLADENRINMRLIPPARGLIFDRNGVTLAMNEQNYRITLVREDAGDMEQVLKRLSLIVPLSEEEIQETIADAKKRSPFVPVTIKDWLSWEDVAEVSINAPALPGITAEVGLSRQYPMGYDTSHVIGYVGPVSDFDLQRLDDQDPLLQIPRFQIGKTGVEAKLERRLRGSAGTKRIEVNAVGRVMRELDRKEGNAGTDLQLTIDASLQNYVQARLKGQAASAVVMDCATGDLLAIGSAPTFDPNLFVRGISSANYNLLRDNKYRPFRSKAVQDIYPPGSTFKMITAMAALEAGLVDFDETVYCPGYTQVGTQRFHCWKGGGHGHVDLQKSLKESCDIYYYDIAQRVGIDKIAEMARKMGIGVRHDIPMSAVAEGLAPDKAWKRSVRDEAWRIGDTVNAAIGQGYVLSSPLQLAVMTARIATGQAIEPRLIKSMDSAEQPIADSDPLQVNPAILNAVRQAMYAVSNDRKGTAYGSRIVEDAFRMAGKTGTSQVRRITAEERRQGITRNEDLPWERRDHALWVNYAPFDNPRIAVSVVVEHGGGGSRAAAPIGRDITLRALYGELPPVSAYPAKDRDRITQQHQAMELHDFTNPTTTDSDRA